MAIFKDNKDFDSTLIVVIYGLALLSHIVLSALVDTYAQSEASKTVGQWVTNVGLVIVGSLFRKSSDPKNE